MLQGCRCIGVPEGSTSHGEISIGKSIKNCTESGNREGTFNGHASSFAIQMRQMNGAFHTQLNSDFALQGGLVTAELRLSLWWPIDFSSPRKVTKIVQLLYSALIGILEHGKA